MAPESQEARVCVDRGLDQVRVFPGILDLRQNVLVDPVARSQGPTIKISLVKIISGIRRCSAARDLGALEGIPLGCAHRLDLGVAAHDVSFLLCLWDIAEDLTSIVSDIAVEYMAASVYGSEIPEIHPYLAR